MSTPKSKFPLRKRRLFAVFSALLLLAVVSSTLASAAEVSLFGSFKQLIGLNAETSTSAQEQPVVTPQPLTIGTCDTAGPIEVESTGGTTAPTAYATLKLAFDAIIAGTHTGSINIEVCGNTTETATAELTASGLAATSYTDVTVRPVGGARIIEGALATAVIKLNGADNVTIDGRLAGAGRNLTVRNNSTAAATAAVWLASVAAGNGASNNTVRNLELAGGTDTSTSANSTFGIIMSGTTISTTSNGVDNDNNSFIANRIVKVRYGIVTRGTTTDLNINPVVTDNIVGPAAFGNEQINKAGIFMQADTGATVSRNTVQFVGCLDPQACTGADRMGIAIGDESWTATTTTTITSANYTVTKNIIHDVVEENLFSAVGIRLGTTQSGSPTNNLIANNFIYNVRSNGTGGDQPVGIGVSGGHTDRIVFNSISITGDMDPGAAGAAATYGQGFRITGANGTNNANFTVMNNSFYIDASSSSTAAQRYYAITLNSNAYSFGTGGLNYNNYYINPANTQLRTGGLGSNTGSAITTEFATLANWQAALTTPQDANSKQADPLYFSNTTDLHIQGTSPNIDMGTPIAGITDDIDSQTRPNGAAVDIGADEFYPAPGSVQLSSATYSATEASTMATITVTRTGGASGAVSVNFATSDGTATGGASCGAGVDYVTTSGTLNWADNDAAPKTFTVTICNDGVLEGSETVNITLSNPTGGVAIGTPSSAVLTILNSTTFSSGSVNVGTGETFTSLTNPGGLFEAINTGAVTANTIINITTDLTAETGAVALNEFSGGFTLTIQPSGGARLISGSNATALLDFNGADGVTIDGVNLGSNLLTIRNTGAGSVVRFINDASNNTVSKTRLEAGSNSSVLFISTGITTGNDNITIDGNLIRDRTDAAGVPFNSINVIGTSAAISNSNILINNNQILNFLQAGIVVGTSDNITFTFNDIFQSASRTTGLFGVAVNSAAGTNLFSQNTIHDLTTTLGTTGMSFNDARNTTVSRNNIFNFPSTSGSTGALVGINFNGSSGNPAAVTLVNNMVSIVPAFTNAQSILGIRDFGFGGNTFNSFFNSVLVSGTGSGVTNTYACQRGSGAPTVSTWTDNICFNNRTGGTGNHFAMGDSSDATGTLTLNYNIYVGTGATAANFFDRSPTSTVTPVSFAAWQAGGRDANSQASNPGGNYTVANMFVAPNDLHLNTSGTNPALDAGTPAGGVTNDFDGQTRPSGAAPEIGADEIVPVVVTNVQFNSATYTGAEGTSATITVTRTGDTTGESSVNYATSDGTATGGMACGSGADYVSTSGTLNFAGGETSKTFNVTLCSDAVVKGDETINLTLSGPTGATLGTPSTAVLTITNVNAPTPGTLALSSATYTVGESGSSVSVTINRTGGSDGEVSVNYGFTDGTATGGNSCGAGVDYNNTGGTVTFAGGETSKSFNVTICSDTVVEGDETFTVTLSGATGGATIGSPASAVITITDDDVAQPGVLALSSATYTVGEAAGTVTVTVNRTGGTDGEVSVNYTLADGTATGGAACGGAVDYVNTGGTVNFAGGQSSQTFTVTICNDATVESNETFTVTLSGAAGGATIGTPSSATVTITDDDTPPPAGNVIVNPGNVAYMTLKEAFDAINAGTHTGAVTVDIAGNTTETASAILNASGTGGASYTSVIIAPTGGARIIEGSIVGAVIKLNGADNVTIDGRLAGAGRNLTVRNNSTAAATAAIWLASVAAGNGASNNVIRNLEIAAGATANVNTNTTIGVLMAGTTVSVTADGNDNDNNQFIANRITKARYGLVTRGVAANNSEGLVITDNIVGPESFGANEIGKAGLFLQGDTGAVVSRNTVQFVGGDLANTTAGADRCGICIGGENWGVTEAGIFQSGDYSVTKNNVHDIVEERTFSAIGIRLGTTRLGMATNNLVANNFVYNVRANATAGDQAVAIGYAAGHTDRIVFNSISMTGDMDPGTAASSTIYGNALRVSTVNGTNNANLTMMNNSIYLDVNSNTAANHYYAITLPGAAYSFGTGGLNFNNYYINQANPQLRTGGLGVGSANTPGGAANEFQTLANWQAALTVPQDANSKQADPLYFSNTSDLHIQAASPNIDMGTPIAGIADDIDTQVRPNGAAVDIGADEFYPAPGTLQFSSPTYSATEISGVATITVTRAGGASGAVSVMYATSDGTAVGGASCMPGVDYVTTSGTLNWADNDFAPKTFNVTLCNDGVFKGNEIFNVTLSNPTGGATLGTPSTATVTILNSTTFGTSVDVGAGQTFTSLTNPGGLFEAINNGALSANLTANIVSDLTAETGAIALNPINGGFTLTIQPSGGAARLISGGSATVLLDFNGADGVTINGLNSGGNSLTIRNTAVGAGTAVRFINDASGNSVLNTTLEGGGTSSVLFISTGVTTGNDNITVTGNIIRDRTDATSVPFNVINLAGTSATVSNSNILINNNQLINFAQAGLFVANADNVTFTGNDVFQTASRTTALFGVAVNSMLGTNLFSQNTIHDLTTTLGVTGLQFNDVRATTVSRNRIYNFPSTSGSTGVLSGIVFNGATGVPASITIVNNMVSIIPNFTNNQIVRGIFDFGFATNVFTSHFNSVLLGGTSTGVASSWACVRGTLAPTTYTMSNNICFNNRTGGTGNHFAAGDQTNGGGTFASNFNIFVGTGVTAANFFDKGTLAAGTPVNFATWQAGPPPRDANSQASNPGGNYTVANMFVSPTDLHLNTSGTNPALNAGTAVGGITTDFDGQTRDSTPDIGADEVVFNLPGTLSLSSSTYSVPENGVMVTITVNRAMGTVGAVSVDYTLGNGTATGGAACGAGVDFVNTGGTVNFAEGEATKTFIVQICDDTVFEGDETFTVTLTNPQGGAVLGTPSSAVVTIVENDPMPVVPSLTINDVSVLEGNSGTSTATFTVSVTNPNDQPISVQYMTVNGTALAGSDYVATSGTLNIPAGQTTATINVTIIGDTIREANETFFVNLSNPTNATITDNQGVGIIIDNDRAVIADFDKDRKSDFSVWRPSDGFWYTLLSTNNVATYKKFGTNGDKPVPGDYDGDGIADIAVFRPSDGTWYIQRSSDFGFIAQQWGLASDRLVQGDYDGDGKTDIAVWRDGFWHIIQSSNGSQVSVQFGATGDIPVQGDYDGDAKTDFAVYRGGTWYVLQSSDGAFVAQQWGLGSDTPIVGDFDGDGSTDFTVYRDGTWYILQSLSGSFRSVSFGTTGDIPVPADFDGDGRDDVAVFRPNGGNWYVLRSSDGAFMTQQWGQNGDVPIPAAYQSRP